MTGSARADQEGGSKLADCHVRNHPSPLRTTRSTLKAVRRLPIATGLHARSPPWLNSPTQSTYVPEADAPHRRKPPPRRRKESATNEAGGRSSSPNRGRRCPEAGVRPKASPALRVLIGRHLQRVVHPQSGRHNNQCGYNTPTQMREAPVQIRDESRILTVNA